MFVFGSLYLPVSTCLWELMLFHNLIHQIGWNRQMSVSIPYRRW